jgi:hypothetical protein
MTSVDMTSVLVHSRATGTTKLVLMGIAYHTGKDRSKGCWPSQLTLAAYAGVSVRQVQRSIQQLIDLGEIETDVRASWKRGDGWYTNLYFLTDLCSDSCHVHQHEVTTSMTEPDDIRDRR